MALSTSHPKYAQNNGAERTTTSVRAQHDSRRKLTGLARLACTAGLALTLTASGTLSMLPSPAYAASAQTLSELSRLQNEVTDAAAIYTEATNKAAELQAQIDASAAEILEIEQVAMPARQQKASEAVSDLYKMHSSASGILALLLNADSFDSFLSLNKYLGTIQNDNLKALEELNQLEAELNEKLETLSEAKDQADAELERASAALAQAKSSAAQMQQKANSENAAEAEAARQAAELAASLENSANNNQGGNQGSTDGGDSNTGGNSGANEPESPANPPSNSNGNTDNGNSGGNSGTDTSSGWKSGVASYYGIGDGFMGGTTANGSIVTETSMGIAMLNVPFGTMVEIRYGGRSVVAVVNDRGPYVHGRVIDMQPAVARALNFLNVGVATVEYRFL